MSKRFKIIFFVRTFGYMLFLLGISGLLAFFAPLLHAEIQYRIDKIEGIKRIVTPDIANKEEVAHIGFENLDVNVPEGEIITPVSTNFGIVIEKINANSKVVANVNPSLESEYTEALKSGVAHAKGTSLPGEKGNTYLFSHSTNAPWNIIRYNAVFYLLREVEPGDKVVIFYNGRRHNYVVFDKHVVDADDTEYLTNKYDKPILTLQTCDPPGTLWKRLIVRAKLEGS